MYPIYHLLSEHTLGAVAANPSWITLTGAINGVAGAIVGAAAAPGTFFPEATTGTHCTQDTCINHSCPSTTFLIITAVKSILIFEYYHLRKHPWSYRIVLGILGSLLLIRFT